MTERRQTALGVARARFTEALPRKAREVRASVALLAATPDDERPREELRRRLHALYASAQVFRIEPLAAALRDVLGAMDRVRDARRGFLQEELDSLATLAARMPALAASAREDDGASVPPPAAAGASHERDDGDDDEGEDGDEDAREAPAARESRRLEPAPRPPSHAPRPQPSAHHTLSTVVSVLVVDAPEQRALVRAALPADRFEVLSATDVEEALRLARSAVPDVVLADRSLALEPGVDLLGRLRDDPLTDFVPVILLLPPGATLDPIAIREAGADDALSKPLEAAAVLRTIERAVQLSGPAGASTLTGSLTLEELAERLADEVKRGIVEAAEKGRDISVPIGDGSPLLAATWSTIGRVRAHVAERSGGRVRFREAPARGGPAFVTVVGEEAVEDALPEGVQLNGRRIIVADDDPAVLWFFSGLFREHGAEVVESSDGIEALEEARRRRPDMVVSDILMPRLDGFGLTRALKRDPVLSDVPVILLSWKEDFLQRMRELKAGASGYLRKEAAAVQILAAVREVLRPRTQLEARLRAGGEVRGRIEAVGVATLLTTVAALRPDARLTVRDASSLYEVDVRGGELFDVNRTASDGAYARGPRVLEAVLGTTGGRYTIADAAGPVRRSLREPLLELLDAGMRALAARVEAVSGKNLSKAAEITLDEDLVASLLRSSPADVERIVEHLRAGGSPRRLLSEGQIEPQVLDEVLVHLARQGAIREVRGPEGEDRIALARKARDENHIEPEPGSASWLSDASGAAPPIGDEALRPAPLPAEVTAERSAAIPVLDPPFADGPIGASPPLPASAPEPAVEADPVRTKDELDEEADALDEEDEAEGANAVFLDGDGDVADEPAKPGPSEAQSSREQSSEERSPEQPSSAQQSSAQQSSAQQSSAQQSSPQQPDEEDSDEEDSVEEDSDEERSLDGTSEPDADADRRTLKIPRLPAGAPPPRPSEEARGMGLVGWVLVLLVLGGIGFVGYRWYDTPALTEPVGPIGPVGPSEAPDEPVHSAREPAPIAPDPEPELVEPEAPAAYGREEPGIAELGVSVPIGQGFLVLEPAPGVPLTVELGEQRLTVASEPVGVALEPGVHHLAVTRGDHRDLIWVAVRAGHTRFVPPLP